MNFIYAWEQNVFIRIEKKPVNDKQIFHTFLFNIRNYSTEVNNIQRREAELDIILPRVNNFDIKQKKAWNICFVICHQHQTRSWKKRLTKHSKFRSKHKVFFVKTELWHIQLQILENHFILFLLISFLKSLVSEIINPWKNQ